MTRRRRRPWAEFKIEVRDHAIRIDDYIGAFVNKNVYVEPINLVKLLQGLI
jgi:hypothetical protein